MNEKKNHSLLEERLRSEAPRFSPGPGFTERVMDKLPARRSTQERHSRDVSWPRLVLGLGTAVCIAWSLMQFLPREARISPPPAVAESGHETEIPFKVPEISLTQVQAFTAKLDEPLETELKNVISDTRQALQFIASNFLPEN